MDQPRVCSGGGGVDQTKATSNRRTSGTVNGINSTSRSRFPLFGRRPRRPVRGSRSERHEPTAPMYYGGTSPSISALHTGPGQPLPSPFPVSPPPPSVSPPPLP